jgi:hypothetical protein
MNGRPKRRPLFGIVGCFIWTPLVLVIFSALGADLWALHPNFRKAQEELDTLARFEQE